MASTSSDGDSEIGSATELNSSEDYGSNGVTKLRLLIVLPLNQLNNTHFPVERDIQTWDHGDEMFPGAQLAVEDINNSPDLLPGYELELVGVSVDPCVPLEVHSNLNAFLPFSNGNLENNFVGMLGLFCGRLLSILSPLAGRDHFGLFQLSGTSSTDVRGKREKYTHLNFAVPSETAYYETFFSLATKLGWRRLLIIDDEFVDLKGIGKGAFSADKFDISFLEMTDSTSVVTLNSEVRRSEKNIVFVSLPPRQMTAVLCGAYDDGLLWPHYVWVLEDKELDDLFNHACGKCTVKKIRAALENTILLNAQFKPSGLSNTIVSGSTYEAFLHRYVKILNESNGKLKYNRYASTMHDSVWAFALALNQSLDEIWAYNTTVVDFVSEFERKNLTTMIETNLKSLSFEGASGRVHFNKDYDVEGLVYVTFVADLTPRPEHNVIMPLVGCYDQLFPGNITINRTLLPSNLPQDKLPSIYNLIPLPVAVVLSVVVILCLTFATFLFVLFIKYRRYSEIKATSPYLSLLMFAGTYTILVSTLVQAVLVSFALPSSNTSSSVLCGSIIAGNVVGINLIFSTLLLRMLRIYRIFSYFGKTGQIWSDKFLVLIVVIVVSGDVVLLLIWFTVDPFTVKNFIVYRPWVHKRPPYYDVSQYCSSDNISIWFTLAFGKVGVLFAVVVFLAVKTRKIQRSNFKDTKKVNIYIFFTVMVIATLIPVWFLLRETGNVIGTGVVIYIAFGATGLFCQLALFAPKVFPPLLRSMGFDIGVSAQSMQSKAIRHRVYVDRRTSTSLTTMTVNSTMSYNSTPPPSRSSISPNTSSRSSPKCIHHNIHV